MNEMSEREQDAAVIAEQAAAERTRADQIVAAVESAREDLLRVWHKARRVDGQDVDTPHTDAISAVCNALFYAAEMPSVVHKDGGNEEIGRNILRIKAWEYYQRIEKAEAERDAARAEVALAWAYLLRYARNTATPDKDVMRAVGILVGTGLPLVELPEDGTE